MLRGKVRSEERDGKDFVHVDSLTLSLAIRKVRMNVSKVFNNNRILSKSITIRTQVSLDLCLSTTSPGLPIEDYSWLQGK